MVYSWSLPLAVLVFSELLGIHVFAQDLVQRAEPSSGEALHSTEAFKSSSKGVQAALQATAQLMLQYDGVTEKGISSRAGIEIEDDTSGARMLRARLQNDDGSVTELEYDRRVHSLSGLHLSYPDGNSIEVTFLAPHGSGKAEAVVTFLEAREHIIMLLNPNLAQIYMVVSINGPNIAGKFQGAGRAWDQSGNVVEVEVQDIANPYDIRLKLLATLSPEHLDFLGVSPTQRLEISPAYQSADFELKRAIEKLVAWAEKIINTEPDELMTSLKGDLIEDFEQGNKLIRKVSRKGKVQWTITFDLSSKRLMHAGYDSGGLELFFDNNEGVQLLGGVATAKMHGLDDVRYMIGFYPKLFAPRIAIVETGSASSSEIAAGAQMLWGPDGEVLVNLPTEAGDSVAELLARIESSLTASSKAATEWRGIERELEYLAGNY